MNESKAMSNILAEIYKNAGFKDLDVSLKSIFQKWQEKYQNTEKFSGLQQAIKTIEEFAYDYWYNNLVVAIPAELLPPGKKFGIIYASQKMNETKLRVDAISNNRYSVTRCSRGLNENLLGRSDEKIVTPSKLHPGYMSLITGADLAKNMFMEETISEIAEELFSEIIQELKEINESTIMQFKSHLNDDHFHYKIGYEPSTLYREDTRHDTTKISEKKLSKAFQTPAHVFTMKLRRLWPDMGRASYSKVYELFLIWNTPQAKPAPKPKTSRIIDLDFESSRVTVPRPQIPQELLEDFGPSIVPDPQIDPELLEDFEQEMVDTINDKLSADESNDNLAEQDINKKRKYLLDRYPVIYEILLVKSADERQKILSKMDAFSIDEDAQIIEQWLAEIQDVPVNFLISYNEFILKEEPSLMSPTISMLKQYDIDLWGLPIAQESYGDFVKFFQSCQKFASELYPKLGELFSEDLPKKLVTQLINSVKNIKYEGQTNIWDHCLQSLSKIKLDTLKDAIGHYLDFPVAAFSVKTICEQETNTAKRLEYIGWSKSPLDSQFQLSIKDIYRGIFLEEFFNNVSLIELDNFDKRWHSPVVQVALVELFDFGGRSWEPLIDKTSVPAFVTQVKNKADAEENTASSKEVTNSNDADDNIGFYIVSLVNHTDNAHEGKVLLHCAGNYTYKCLYQSSHLLSVRDKKGKSLSTIELVLQDNIPADNEKPYITLPNQAGYLIIEQHYAVKNSEPPEICKNIFRWLVEKIESGEIKVDAAHLEQARKKRKQKIETMAFEDKMIVKFGFNPLDPKRIKEATSLYLKILQTENFAQIKRNIKNGYDRVHAAMVSYVSDLQQNIKDDANQSVLLTQGVDIYIGSDSNVEINPSARFNFRGLSEDNVETISQEHLVNCNELQESPLFLALTNNNIAIAEKILRRYQQKLQHISTVTKEFSFCFDIDHSNAFGETALFVAAARGHHQAVKLLLQLDASANKCRRDGLTPLHVAIAENQFEVAAILIQHLINKSASTRLMDDKGRTPIWFAVQKGCLSLVKTLWSDDDRKYTDKNGDNLLVIAAEFGQVELVKFFRDNQMSIDQTDDAGYTLVMQALKNQQITRAKILIQQGASVVKMGSDGATALKLAKKLRQDYTKTVAPSNQNQQDYLETKISISQLDEVIALIEFKLNIDKAENNLRDFKKIDHSFRANNKPKQSYETIFEETYQLYEAAFQFNPAEFNKYLHEAFTNKNDPDRLILLIKLAHEKSIAAVDRAEMTKLCEVAKNSFEAQGRHVGMKMAQVLLGHLESKLSTDNSVEVPTLS